MSYVFPADNISALDLDDGSMERSSGDFVGQSNTPTSWDQRMRWSTFSKVEYLVESSCLRPKRFLAWKLFAFLWSVSIYITTLAKMADPKLKFYVFLTNWNQTSLLLYFTSSLYVCARHWLNREPSEDVYESASVTTACRSRYQPSSYLLRWTFVLMEHSFAWTCLVVLVYWTTEFPHWVDTKDPTPYDFFANVHGMTMILISIDLYLNRVEFVFAHLVYTLPMSVIYVTVNGVYCALAGGYIYEVLKWDGVVTGIAIVGCSVFLVAMYPFGRWLCGVRNRWTGNKQQDISTGAWCTCK